MVDQLLDLVGGFDIGPVALLDILLTALLIYGLVSLIRGTRAVRLIIGVSVLYAIYVAAQAFGLQLLTQIMQAGAVVGLLAIVVVFQPELRRALERIGRVGSLGWLLAPTAHRSVERVAGVVARSAASLAAQRIWAR
jgi:diadenylate cyclase